MDKITVKVTDQNNNELRSEGEALSFCIWVEQV
jgi:hypothetical protein